MRTYYVYKVTNKINGKIYIGRTVNFFARITQHCKESVKDENEFHKDIRAYGIKNFSWEVLEVVSTKEEADELEKHYIDLYNSVTPNGYNNTYGGTGGVAHNIKSILRFDANGNVEFKYQSASQAARDGFPIHGVLDCCEGYAITCGGKHFMYEEDYKKRGFSKREKKLPSNTKKVVQCDLDGNFIAEYKSVTDAAKATGLKRPSISANITGERKQTGKYIFVYKEDFPIKHLNEHKQRIKGKKVASVDKETGDIVAVYNSVAEAGRCVNGNYKYIHRILDQSNRTAYGFKWITL